MDATPVLTLALASSLLLGMLIAARLALGRCKQACAEQERELIRFRWLEWWVRNAAEMTPLDPSRADFARLAYAAQLAPSLSAFLQDLDTLRERPGTPPQLREVAGAYAAELRAPRASWVVWREETGKPLHAAEPIAKAYREAIGLSRIPHEGIAQTAAD